MWRSCTGGKILTEVLETNSTTSWIDFAMYLIACTPDQANGSCFNCCYSQLQIQSKRVDCFRELKTFMKSAVTASGDSIEASLRVRMAEMSVTFLQQEYEKTKTEQESAEVSTIITVLMFAYFQASLQWCRIYLSQFHSSFQVLEWIIHLRVFYTLRMLIYDVIHLSQFHSSFQDAHVCMYYTWMY